MIDTDKIKINLLGDGRDFRECKHGDEPPFLICATMCGPGQQCNVVVPSAADKMFDNFQKRGLDELQKFFDGGGKLDFSEVGSVDEIAELVRSSLDIKRGDHD